jgi:predicted nucleotidyltransferase
MNKATQNFLEELKQRADVVGVIMFGSWARGNNRPDSDVDLVVILTDGYRRTVEHRDGQAFEIIYTTEKGAFEYWESHKDDAAGLWAVAKILFDKDGTIEHLKTKIKEVLDAGKKPIDEYQLGQFRFDAEDQLKYIESILASDPTTANLILTNKIFALTELFFDIRQIWTPAPKQRLAEIQKISPDSYALLKQFYQEQIGLKERLEVARKIVPLVFDNKN